MLSLHGYAFPYEFSCMHVCMYVNIFFKNINIPVYKTLPAATFLSFLQPPLPMLGPQALFGMEPRAASLLDTDRTQWVPRPHIPNLSTAASPLKAEALFERCFPVPVMKKRVISSLNPQTPRDPGAQGQILGGARWFAILLPPLSVFPWVLPGSRRCVPSISCPSRRSPRPLSTGSRVLP